MDLRSAGQRYLRAAGSLGWAFPAAIGAKCAAPDKPVVCFAGDGAFMYHLTELETARRYGIPVVVVVNNNSCLAQGARAIRASWSDWQGLPDKAKLWDHVRGTKVAKREYLQKVGNTAQGMQAGAKPHISASNSGVETVAGPLSVDRAGSSQFTANRQTL